MEYEEFIQRVQDRSRLPTREDAARITEATLETLGERIYRTQRDGLAAQLPKKLKESIYRRQESAPTTRQHTDRYSLQEFYQRVGARADTGYYDAAERAKAVMSVLQEAVTAEQMQQVMENLPEEYGDLLRSEPKGPGFPSLK